MRLLALALLSLFISTSKVLAWWDEGHMRIAVLAWDQMTLEARAEASRLIRMNPQYNAWVAAVPQPNDGSLRDLDRYTFVRAAAWADDIKEMPDYVSKGDDAKSKEAGRNIGYADKLAHPYWHYKDIPYSLDGSVPPVPEPVDAATQIKLFREALPKSAGFSDDIRSYDLVWIIHLVGDVHQPLHSTTLFTKAFTAKWQSDGKPDLGDRGGNEILVKPANGDSVKLHAYFDGIFGGYSTVIGAIADSYDYKTKKSLLPEPDPKEAAITDVDVWIAESNRLAISTAYASPILDATGEAIQNAELTRNYETNARAVAKLQLPLAAARLARMLNDAFQ